MKMLMMKVLMVKTRAPMMKNPRHQFWETRYVAAKRDRWLWKRSERNVKKRRREELKKRRRRLKRRRV